MSKLIMTPHQQKAIDIQGKNLLVAAGAGSGKTRVLTERVIMKLINGVPIHQMIILTFTNAAADEMKQRIKRGLQHHPELSKELDQIDTAMISTFDAFVLRIVQQYHYLLKIPQAITIVDNVLLADMKDRCLKDTLDQFYAHADESFSRVAIELFDRGDDLLKEGVITLSSGLEMVANPLAMIASLCRDYDSEMRLTGFANSFFELCREQIAELKIEYDRVLHEAALIDNDKLVQFSKRLAESYEPLFRADSLDRIISVMGDWRHHSLPRVSKTLTELDLVSLREVYQRLRFNFESLRKIFKKCQWEDQTELMEDVRRTRETIHVILSITQKYMERLNQQKRDMNRYHFTDVMQLAITLFEDHPALLAEFRSQIHEVMIDEYQDTNDLQEYLLQLIASDCMFTVGDIKQSIYGFRNANPRNFSKKYHDYCRHIGGEAIDLRENFRSRSEVIQAINQIFSRLMDDKIGGIEYQDNQSLIAGNQEYDRHRAPEQSYYPDILFYHTDQDLATKKLSPAYLESVAIKNDIIAKISAGYQVFDPARGQLRPAIFADFAIIVDRKTDFPLIQKTLVFGKIPVTAHTDTPFSVTEEIQFLTQFIHLLDALRQPTLPDRFLQDLCGVCRSFVYRLSDESIVKMCLDMAHFKQNIWENLGGNPVFSPVINHLNQLLPEVDRLPIQDLLWRIYQITGLHTKIADLPNPESREKKLDFLYQKMGELTDLDFAGLCDYLAAIDRLNDVDIEYSEPHYFSTNAVHLLTMHKSKGLEFPICYYPGLSKRFNYTENKQHFIYHRQIGLFCKAFHNGFKSTFLHALSEEENYQEYVSERIRLLYVALTRAKEKQVILLPDDPIDSPCYSGDDSPILPIGVRRKTNRFSTLFKQLGLPLSWYKAADLSDHLVLDQKEPIMEMKHPIRYDKFSFPTHELVDTSYAKETTSLMTADEIKSLNYGKKLHSILQNVDFRHIDSSLAVLGPSEKTMVMALVDTEPFRQLEQKSIYQEYAFIDTSRLSKSKGVIDLLLVGQSQAWLIDYKLKKIDDPAYLYQLAGYKAYVEQLIDKPVSTYLFSLLDHSLHPIGGITE